MSEAQEHEFDKLSRKIIKKAGMETPPQSLKLNIMQAIHATSAYSSPRSLISKKGKIAIGILVIGFCIVIGFLPQTKEVWEISGALSEFTGVMEQISYHIPKTFFYGILAFGLLISVQIGYLKYRINRI